MEWDSLQGVEVVGPVRQLWHCFLLTARADAVRRVGRLSS